MSNPSELNALVFGASGITGWAIVKMALEYPSPATFSRVIGLTNRPLTLEDSRLTGDPRLSLRSGFDLSGNFENTRAALQGVEGIEKVTHVYFTAYVHKAWGADGSKEQVLANVELLMNSVKAVDELCLNLQFVTWPSGGKWYGFEHAKLLHPKAPFKETDARISAPYAQHVFYYNQHDALSGIAKGKKWTFADIRPDAIVGFVPNNNPMNLAQPIGIYLSLWSHLNHRKPAPFPGTTTSYRFSQSNGFQDIIAKMHIYVSLHPEKTAGQSYNIADEEFGRNWESTWPGICKYFGIEAGGPPEDGSLTGEGWVLSERDRWSTWEVDNGLKSGVVSQTAWGFMTTVLGEYSEFDRSLDISAARKIGFAESIDHVQSYYRTFDRMREARMIPSM